LNPTVRNDYYCQRASLAMNSFSDVRWQCD
jgi:hypothetical protein